MSSNLNNIADLTPERKAHLFALSNHWILHTIRIPFEIVCGTTWLVILYATFLSMCTYFRITLFGYKDKSEMLGLRKDIRSNQ
jgi:hypothetical protein